MRNHNTICYVCLFFQLFSLILWLFFQFVLLIFSFFVSEEDSVSAKRCKFDNTIPEDVTKSYSRKLRIKIDDKVHKKKKHRNEKQGIN